MITGRTRTHVVVWFITLTVNALLGVNHVVQATCLVQSGDEKETTIPLDELPSGVMYMDVENTIYCLTERSCEGYLISGCQAVYCEGRQSCRNVEFKYNEHVFCWAEKACQQADFWQSHDIDCGSGNMEDGSCLDATIQTDADLLCYGDRSCVYEKPLSVHLVGGEYGQVRCESPNPGLGVACKNMFVHVDDRRRACFVNEDQNIASSPCAVFCANRGACDKQSIIFEIYGQQSTNKKMLQIRPRKYRTTEADNEASAGLQTGPFR